ncbi:hypothetical protein [Rossellomorea marisflavi]|uniref:hypothetical protein n=1 Tax=Rossellomorea marisflavi TaxID=189381 RepID=UPI003FA0FDF2
MVETTRIEIQLVRKILMSFHDMSKLIEEKRDRSSAESGFYAVFNRYKKAMVENNRKVTKGVTLVVSDELFDELFKQATLLVREIEEARENDVIQDVFCHYYFEYLKHINLNVP